MDSDNDADAEPQHEGFEQASTYKKDADVPIPTSSTASDISIYSNVLFIREPFSFGLRQFGIRLVNCSVAHRLKKIRLSEPQVSNNCPVQKNAKNKFFHCKKSRKKDVF